MPPWEVARSFDDLCTTMAKCIESGIDIYGGELWEETGAIRPILAQLNHQGFLTVSSQPGVAWDEKQSKAQRAYVEGFVLNDFLVEKIERRLLKTGIYFAAYQWFEPFYDLKPFYDLNNPANPLIITTFKGGRPHTGCSDNRHTMLEMFRELCAWTDAYWQLSRATFVVLIDHDWGRNMLFDEVAKCFGGGKQRRITK